VYFLTSYSGGSRVLLEGLAPNAERNYEMGDKFAPVEALVNQGYDPIQLMQWYSERRVFEAWAKAMQKDNDDFLRLIREERDRRMKEADAQAANYCNYNASVTGLIPGGQVAAAVFAFLGWQYGKDPKDRIGPAWTQEEFERDFRPIMENRPTLIDPVVLDLKGSGRIDTLDVNNGLYCDYYADGFLEATGWVSPDAGILVIDRNGDGIVNNVSELFGDQTPLPNGQPAGNGFQALAALDGNKDGKISAADRAFPLLKVWRHANGDGYSDQDELRTDKTSWATNPAELQPTTALLS
jgi:hypothetical protein